MDLFLKIKSVIRFGTNDALFLEYDISSTGIIAIDVQFFSNIMKIIFIVESVKTTSI